MNEIINDLRSKRDALSLAHQKLKTDSDDWNKGIIIISLVTGLLESIKMKLSLDGAGWALVPIILSSVTAACSALMKFRDFPKKMEVLIQSGSLLTNTLNKARNHHEVDDNLFIEYNSALEHLETSLYPDQRKLFLKQSHKNLIEITKQEVKYFDLIEKVNAHEKVILSDESSSSSDSSEEKIDINIALPPITEEEINQSL
ncbi:MAG: hypothetical protein CL524_08065 [Aequorivita sp.]|nr:hypothetical protein [Aequorivita sp.]